MQITKGCAELGVRRVVDCTYQDNRASRWVMEKAGMRLVPTYRPTPQKLETWGVTSPERVFEVFLGDDVEYAVTKGEWELRNR